MSPKQNDMIPTILSMEVDVDNEVESEYRLRVGTQIKYLKIAPGTFDSDLLSFPIASLPPLPYEDKSWTTAHLSRDEQSGNIKTSLSNQKLAGVQNVWHNAQIDILDLTRTQQLTGATFEALMIHSTSPQEKVIAKIARFEWDIPRIERETRAYQLLQQEQALELAPRFLGHIHEDGRVIGLLLEKLPDMRHASIEDLESCESALSEFHRLDLLHGDVNRYNFLVGKDVVKLVDFEHLQEGVPKDLRMRELQSLQAQLMDTSGRGGGFIFSDDEE